MWSYTDDTHKAAAEEIERMDDRGAAVVAASFLEERLKDLLIACFQRDRNIENDVLQGTGPLATFSSRIHLGFLLGLYDKKVHRTLRIIKDIRNEFAHKFQPISFDTPYIKDKCANLVKVGPNSFPDYSIADLINAKEVGNDTIQPFAGLLKSSIFNVEDTSRNRYISSVKILLWLFTLNAIAVRRRLDESPLLPITPAEHSSESLPVESDTSDGTRKKPKSSL